MPPRTRRPSPLLRVVRSWTNNYAGLAKVHQLVTEIVAGGVGREEAVRRLEEITHSSKPFPRWMVTVAFGVFSAVFVGVLGGGLGASVVAFVSNLLVSLLARQLGRWRTPDFFITASCSFLVTIIALLLWRFGGQLGMQIAPAIVVVGGILLLLPTGRLVSSVQDAINGFPVTAAGRFLSTLLTFGALVAGIAVGFVVGELTGSEPIDVTKTFPPAYDLWVVVILTAIAVIMIGITEQTRFEAAASDGGRWRRGLPGLDRWDAAGIGPGSRRRSPPWSSVFWPGWWPSGWGLPSWWWPSPRP